MQYGIYAVSKNSFLGGAVTIFFYFKNEFHKLISGDKEHLNLIAVYLKVSQCPVMRGTWKMVFEPCSHVISTFFNFFSSMSTMTGNEYFVWFSCKTRALVAPESQKKVSKMQNLQKWPKMAKKRNVHNFFLKFFFFDFFFF